MERMPTAALVVAALVFAALAVWSATDENWAGLIAGVVLLGICVAQLSRRTRSG